MVPAAGVEPATFRSGGERSNPLSYAGVMVERKDITPLARVATACLSPLQGWWFLGERSRAALRLPLATFSLRLRRNGGAISLRFRRKDRTNLVYVAAVNLRS